MLEFKEIKAKTILTRCGIPGIDYVINPYIGCRFACKYCYASFMGRFVGKTVFDWGEYVYAKVNAAKLLKKELPKKLRNKGVGKEIFLSSVTDPYQGLEAKYRLTRSCLEVLLEFGYQGLVSILTKSDMVIRDIDIFRRLPRVSVGLTVTSTDDTISRYFEKYAPPVSKRLNALKVLNQNGIKTYAFIGPLLPHFIADVTTWRRPSQSCTPLETLFKKLQEVGTKDIFIEHLNLSTYIRNRLLVEMKGANKEIVKKFYLSQSKEYRRKLEEEIRRLVAKYKMHLLLDMVIYHKEFHPSLHEHSP